MKADSAAPGPVLIGLSGAELSKEEAQWLQHPAVGGVVLFTRRPWLDVLAAFWPGG